MCFRLIPMRERRRAGMREILFRGKRIDDCEWIESYIVKLGRESFSDPERYGICNKAIPIGGSGVCYNLKIDEVIPKTVGQFTGLTDKNGKKIFEGDILEVYENEQHKQRVLVFFEKGHFVVSHYAINLLCERNLKSEVIGNIHDNPELLKGNVE